MTRLYLLARLLVLALALLLLCPLARGDLLRVYASDDDCIGEAAPVEQLSSNGTDALICSIGRHH